MKRKKLLDSMEHLDDAFILEAAPKSKKKFYIRIATLAASLLLVVSLGLVLFLPLRDAPPDVSRYADSPYYTVIQKLNAVTYRKPAYKNNFLRLINGGLLFMKAMDGVAAPESATGSAASYEEVTDNQVQGVIEADLLKRTDQYFFYLNPELSLSVYPVDPNATAAIETYVHPTREDRHYLDEQARLYLSTDARTLTLIAPYMQKQDNNFSRSCVELVSLDVSDPTNLRVQKTVSISGSYLSSRAVDGKLLLLSTFYVGQEPDFSKEENFLPQIDLGNGFQSIPLEDIYSPEALTTPRYTVVVRLNESDLTYEDAAAFLSYSHEVYVSQSAIYVSRAYTNDFEEGKNKISVSMTEISRLSYKGEQMTHLGSVSICGTLNDQFSMDEYEDHLRVVTTTQETLTKPEAFRNDAELAISATRKTNASLYVVRLSDMQIAAKVERFAPEGESVRSVRFDGTAAYVCTSIQLSDPVFFFDLSDLQSITYTDTGTIDGFSTSLVQLGNGLLLGIGRGSEWSSVKLEIYEEQNGAVVSVAAWEVPNASISSDYKAYLINREEGIFGLGVVYGSYVTSQTENNRYVLLAFDGNAFCELLSVPLAGPIEHKRAVLIDRTLYMFGANDFRVATIP